MADLDSIDRALSYAWPYRLIKSAITAPRDAYTGKLQMQAMDPDTGEIRTSPEAIQRANDLAAMAMSGTSFRVPKGSQPLYGDVLGPERREPPPLQTRRNSMYADEMLEPESYSLPPQPRNRQITFDPNFRDPAFFGKRTEPDPRLAAGDEGFGSNARDLGVRQGMSRQAEQDFIRDQLARMGDEGNVAPSNELLRRQINAEADRRFAQNQLSALEGEGGVTADAIQAAKDLHNRRIGEEQARREMEVARWEDEGGGMAHTRVPPVFTRDFIMGETEPMTHGIPKGRPYYGPLATRSSTDMVSTASPEVAEAILAAQGAGRSNIPLLAALGLGGGGGIYGLSQLYGDKTGAAIPPSGGQITQEERVAPAPQQRRELPPDAVDGFVLTPGAENIRANPVIQQAMEAIRQGSAQRQEAPKAQERTTINWGDPDRASDFFRASKQMQEAINAGKDVGYYGQKEKRGGSVEKKPDSVHKALEIIHHLITR